MHVTFNNPEYLYFLALLPILYLIALRFKKRSTIRFSSLSLIKEAKPKRAILFKNVPLYFRCMVLALLVVAIARPQIKEGTKDFTSEGIDIVLALDLSGSMQAEDFETANRLEIAKEEARKFIKDRPYDRIALVVFSQYSITQCPLTLDHSVVLDLLDSVQTGHLKDGTAIGMAIANAVNRLRDSQAKGKVIILITDGENNAGNIDPITAAEVAKSFNIKVYAIGVGKGGKVPFPVDDPIFGRRYLKVEVNIDEDTLIKIADITDGLYFRARDQKSLEEIYKKIDTIEKTEIKVTEYVSQIELFQVFAYAALLMLIIECVLTNTMYLKLP